MKRQTKKVAAPLSLLLAELTVFSWETVARRAAMMVQGTCSTAEYQRMLFEKMRAAQLSAAALMPCRQLAKLAATREPGSQRKHESPKLDDN